MADITTTYPNIEASEKIRDSWSKFLTRDNSAITNFAAEAFPTGLDNTFIGLTVYRTDLKRKFTYLGEQGGSDIWADDLSSVTSDDVQFDNAQGDFPPTVKTVTDALDYLEAKSEDHAIVYPPEELEFTGDGSTDTFAFSEAANDKSLIKVYCSGVKQVPSSYDLVNNGQAVQLKIAPRVGEIVNIVIASSVLEYELIPLTKVWTADGVTSTFDMGVDLVDPSVVSVNIDKEILQISEYTVSGPSVVLNAVPSSGALIQIQTVHRASVNTPADGSITNEKLADNTIRANKLANNIITANKMATNSVGTSQLINNSVTSDKLAAGSIDGSKLVDASVLLSKLETAIINRLLGTANVESANLGNKSVTVNKLADDVKALIDAGNVPDASTTVKGIGMLATLAQVQGGTGGNKFVPANVLTPIYSGFASQLLQRVGYYTNLVDVPFSEMVVGVNTVRVTRTTDCGQPGGPVDNDTSWIVHVEEILNAASYNTYVKVYTCYGGNLQYSKVWRAVAKEEQPLEWTLIQAPVIKGSGTDADGSWWKYEIDEVKNTLKQYGNRINPAGGSAWDNAIIINLPISYPDTKYIFNRASLAISASGSSAAYNSGYTTKTPNSISMSKENKAYTTSYDWITEGEYK